MRAAAPPRGLSRRAAVLVVLLLAIATAMAPFMRALVEQQSRIASLEEDVAQRERDVDDLDRQLGRWQDPAFVVAQARQRFTYVMPGEVGYVVLDEAQVVQDLADPSRAAAREVSHDDASWFGALWSSVELAGRSPTQQTGPVLEPSAPTTPVPAPETTEEPQP